MEAIEKATGREVFREIHLPPARFQTDFPPGNEEGMTFLNAILRSLVEDESLLRLDCVDVFLKARDGDYQSVSSFP